MQQNNVWFWLWCRQVQDGASDPKSRYIKASNADDVNQHFFGTLKTVWALKL